MKALRSVMGSLSKYGVLVLKHTICIVKTRPKISKAHLV
jgi:hypothetical protein